MLSIQQAQNQEKLKWFFDTYEVSEPRKVYDGQNNTKVIQYQKKKSPNEKVAVKKIFILKEIDLP